MKTVMALVSIPQRLTTFNRGSRGSRRALGLPLHDFHVLHLCPSLQEYLMLPRRFVLQMLEQTCEVILLELDDDYKAMLVLREGLYHHPAFVS